MSAAPAALTSTLDEDAWDDLLSYIEDRRVIPIVGPELLLVATDRGPRLLLEWVAEKLAGRLNVNVAELPQPYTLNDVVCWFLAARGRREEAYVRLRGILKDANIEPPLALRRLAAITDFDLFISTTFDSLLESAINLERFGGTPSTDVLSYAPNRIADLPSERDQLQRPVVYHLFGKLAASPTYVISDEDLLEFICALQNEHLAPERLFHELEHSHLLFIGSNFTNWLARLFLRMAKRQRLSDPRDVGEVLADDHSSSDDRLMSFLQQVSVRTRIYTGADRFVEELHARWQARRKPSVAVAPAPARVLPPAREVPDNAVVITNAVAQTDTNQPAGGPPGKRPKGNRNIRTVYLQTGDENAPQLQQVQVKIGITDGIFTEVTDGLKDTDKVVTGVVSSDSQNPAGGSTPFGGGFGRMR